MELLSKAPGFYPRFAPRRRSMDTKSRRPRYSCMSPSPTALRSRPSGRPDGWFRSQPEEFQTRQVEMHCLYNVELKRQAEAFGLPILESEPFDTLLDRAIQAIEK